MSGDNVSLVVPGHNCARTIRPCLDAVMPLLRGTRLREIIFVDDGSTDDTATIVAQFPLTCVRGPGQGPGAARNIGWRAARNPLVWFVDADCVAEPDALDLLLPHMNDPKVGGVGGSYGIMNPESLLACLIHEEIMERHRRMPQRVDFLATFNVIYRREVLEQVNGFDERLLKGQDAELSWRVLGAGYELGFAFDSRVKHFHASRLGGYLRTQRRQGYWRVWLHLAHRGHTTGDTYSTWVDHVQPPLAMLILAAAPPVVLGRLAWIPVTVLSLLAAVQVPMTVRLMRRNRRPRYLLYAAMSFVRAFWRGVGMLHGMLSYLATRRRR